MAIARVLLLVSLLASGAVAGAQGVVSDSLEQQAATRVADAVCNKQVVLLGELPEHGEARGMGVKARIIERLVQRCGFRTVLFESGSYDFFGLERAIAATAKRRGDADSLALALARAIGGLWWTRELGGWRQWLVQQASAGRIRIGGIDDQLSATATFAKATLPGLIAAAVPATRATECREAITRYGAFRYDAATPYDSTERARLADCSRSAAERSLGSRAPASPDEVMLVDAASYFARERANADRGVAPGPDRDEVMARHVAQWSARLPRGAKIVVWTASVHAARAPVSSALPTPKPMGAWLAERFGDRLAAIGFTALQGEWSRVGKPAQPLAPLAADALESRALAARGERDRAAWAYLDRAALRTLGATPSRILGRATAADWSAAFDGVVVIRDESGPTA